MTALGWLKHIFLKGSTFGAKDIKRNEKLSRVLKLVLRTSKQDWKFEKNRKVVKDTIPHKICTGLDLVASDGFSASFYLPRYEIDKSREPINIYENWPHFFSLVPDKGFMTFHSADDDIFCKGEIIGMVNSEVVIEEITRDRTCAETDLLDFFDELRAYFKEKR
ncbi:MAG: hypothetical protein AAB596_00660 [Patescibacteria group bacterium]